MLRLGLARGFVLYANVERHFYRKNARQQRCSGLMADSADRVERAIFATTLPSIGVGESGNKGLLNQLAALK
jgi:hypothetical protein